MIEEKTEHNTKYILERIDRIISIYFYLVSCYYLVMFIMYLIKGNFTVPVTVGFLIIFALFFLSAEGLRRGKVWGKSVALFTSLLLCFVELSNEIKKGEMINPMDFLILSTFGGLSIYLIASMIIQKRERKSVKKGEKKLAKICVHCCTKLEKDAKVCSYCGKELSEEDTRAL